MDRGQTFLRELGVDFLLSQIHKYLREPLPWAVTPTAARLLSRRSGEGSHSLEGRFYPWRHSIKAYYNIS
jgi:hypothetical protein